MAHQEFAERDFVVKISVPLGPDIFSLRPRYIFRNALNFATDGYILPNSRSGRYIHQLDQQCWLRCGFAFYVSWKAHPLAIPCIQKPRKNFCCAFCRCNKLARARITFKHVMPAKYANDYKIMQNMQRIIETRAGKNFMPCIRYWSSNSHYTCESLYIYIFIPQRIPQQKQYLNFTELRK